MTDTYDCSPHPREGVVHHTARVIHNLFHPHHPQPAPLFPIALSCAVPEMETVTVTAEPTHTNIGVPAQEGGSMLVSYAPGYGYSTGFPEGVQPVSTHPVAVPEPGALLLLAVGMAAVFLRCFRRA